MATEPTETNPDGFKDEAILEKDEEEEVQEEKNRGEEVEEAADNAESERGELTASNTDVSSQEVKEERAVSITISSHLSYRERTASENSGTSTATTVTITGNSIYDATSADAISLGTNYTDTTFTDATSADAISTDFTIDATTTGSSPQPSRDRKTSYSASGATSFTSTPAPITSSQAAFKGRDPSNILDSTTNSGHPSKGTDLSSDSSGQVKEGHEGAKEGGNIMGGDWRKVISQRRGATCSVEVISKLKPSEMSLARRRAEREFCTGSTFVGQVDAIGMEGECTAYTMPHGVVFEGAMNDGRFEGPGTLTYPNKGRVDGTFKHGKLAPSTYTFPDGLVYELTDWTYCSSKTPDRRFQQEIKFGLKPVCTSLKTQLQPTRPIPKGCYDTGDGFYNPSTRCVTSAKTGNIIRIPTKSEANWIAKHCRKAWDEPSGFRPKLNENFRYDDVNYGPLLIAQRRRRREQDSRV